jgi:acyl-CoA synthetase (NDP forming)
MSVFILEQAIADGRESLSEAEGKKLLNDRGIKVPKSVVVHDAASAANSVSELTGPFVVKVMSPDILHKSDAGGVALDLADADAVSSAIAQMAAIPAIAEANVVGWLVEEMVPTGREVVIGGFRDLQFGPMLMVGLGGVFVEVLKDVSFRLCPIAEDDARAMLKELRGYQLLMGARGEKGVDIEGLVEVMVQIGGDDGLLMQGADQISELDLNPVLVSPNGVTVVDARVILEKQEPRQKPPVIGSDLTALERFRPLFEPRTVAVLGASTKETTIANTFIRRMREFGFEGDIYPIHPKAPEVEGLKAYLDLASTPAPVDYAYIAIGAGRIPDAVGTAAGNCRIAQVISSGFAEVEEGRDLQAALVRKAHGAGVRLLGPNCLGTYSPRGGLTFPVGAPKDVGPIGVVSQSGGLSTDIIKRGQWRGIRFSGLVTIGNSADLTPTDLLEYYFADPQTRAVGLYVEDIVDGRAFFDLLRSGAASKPVVILKGGRSSQGRLAAASHTGALAGDERAWDALEAQACVKVVPHVNAFLDTLLALQSFELRAERPTRSVTLFGNGGGSSVLGSDAFASVGLDVSPFDDATFSKLKALGLPPGTSVANPVDTPVRTLQEKEGWIAGEILDIICDNAGPDAIAMHLNLAAFVGRGDVDPIDNLVTVIEQSQSRRPGQTHFGLALRSDGSPELEEKKRAYKERARRANIPVFDEIPELATALANVAHLERRAR